MNFLSSIANHSFPNTLDTKKNYKQITGVHVYSLTSFDPNDFSLLYSACKDIPRLTLEDRVKCGVLKNDNVTFKKLSASRSEQTQKPVVVEKPFAKVTPAKPISKSTSVATKRKGTLSFGPATTKKQAIDDTKPEDDIKQDFLFSKPVSKSVSKPVVESRKKATQMKGENNHGNVFQTSFICQVIYKIT
jgi:hypothetical protein